MIWKDLILTEIKFIMSLRLNKLKKKAPSELSQKPKKKVDRFDGLTEEDLQSYKLPDILKENLDMVFVGINPSLTAAFRGRYYAGPGNHFYKLLYESKLTPRLLNHEEDSELLQYGIGLTNIVERPSRSSSDLKKSEIQEGAKNVEKKLILFQPKIAIFNGKGIYEIFSNKTGKSDFSFGLQPVRIGNTALWVVPSSSARCAHFPRMVDKLHFYSALKKYLLYINGKISDIDEKEFSFDGKCRIFDPTTSKMWRRKGVSAFMRGGRVANKETMLNSSATSVSILRSNYCRSEELEIEKSSGELEEFENTLNEDAYKGIENSSSKTLQNLDDLRKYFGSNETEEENCDSENQQVKDNSIDLSKPINLVEKKHEIDFIDIIKQRLSQRDNSDQDKCELEVSEESSKIFQSIKQESQVKKLKYFMLKKNRSSNLFAIQKSQLNSSDSET